ncbi:MAG: hypothetical protein Q7T79_01470 [bacterium]|nr:hypothetical protein [bacterium]
MKNFIYYIKERFPIIPALIFSFLFSLTCSLYITRQYGIKENIISIFLIAMTITLFLLRLRLWDEIKDFKYDSKFHADRPIQKGLISIKQIKIGSFFILITELLIQLFLPNPSLILFLITFFYSLLIFKDFFIPSLKKANFFFYILLHQVIFLFYIYYSLSVNLHHFFIPQNLKDFSVILTLFLPAYIYEIGRKCKHRISHDGKQTDDTYIYLWGELKSMLFLFTLLFLQSLSLFLVLGMNNALLYSHLAIILILFILFFIYRKKIINTSDKWSIALGIYGLIILNYYLFL